MPLSPEALKAAITRQQSDSGLYPMEFFCEECGTGHFATPGCERGRCQRCDAPGGVFHEHPIREVERARRAARR